MSVKSSAVSVVNSILRPFKVELRRVTADKPWDNDFRAWIAMAKTSGKDPNDVGDAAWADDPLKQALEQHYLPHMHPNAVVLELGPGTGRLTRHIISRCKEMVLVDYSAVVCGWLAEYFKGKGQFQIHQLHQPAMPMVADKSIDVALANGVFEHIDFDDVTWFFADFYRVLKPGGVMIFNFDNLMSGGGIQHLKRYRGSPGERNIFRFYHPEAVKRLAEDAGFEVVRVTTDDSRFAFMKLKKR